MNRQRGQRVDVAGLESLAQRAVPDCLRAAGSGECPLAALAEVEVVLVSDRVIAKVHADFSGVPGPTDVITFQHGELVISAETAWRQAEATGEPFQRELLRYLVHGLLHLNGHLDGKPALRRAMWRVQEAALRRVWSHGCEK